MAGSGNRVGLDDAQDPFVLALDVGSTASRGDVYDAAGRPVKGGRQKVPHEFRTSGDGASEIDPDQVSTSSQRSSPAWPLRRCRAGSAAWRWTRSPRRWSAWMATAVR
jgi:hypothetical protein